MKYFEDIALGDRMPVGAHTFKADEIKAFAARFDPQPFHLDENAAGRSHFGALCASGWHTAVAWMRLMVDSRRRQTEAARARGEPVAAMGPALGFRELKWMKPVLLMTQSTIRVKSSRRGSRKAARALASSASAQPGSTSMASP